MAQTTQVIVKHSWHSGREWYIRSEPDFQIEQSTLREVMKPLCV